ncbi:MAG: hypothetical protein AB7Y46_14580, partial [Armatimonadota bacterium]
WIRVEGTQGTAHWDFQGPCRIEYADGSRQVIEPDGRREHDEVFRNAIRYLRGIDQELNCPVAMTRPLTVAVIGAYESGAPPRAIPPEHVTREPRGDKTFTGINGIGELLDRCYAQHLTFYDAGAPWSYATEWFDTRNYTRFEMDLG